MRIIDVQTWNRKAHYDCFSRYSNPIFSMSVKMDVSNLVGYCKETDKSFFASFLYVVSKCMNDIEEFRIRLVEDEVVVYDSVNPSYIVMANDGVIVTCCSKFDADYKTFYATVRDDIAKSRLNSSRASFNSQEGAAVLYVSCIPWVSFQSVSNPFDYSNKMQSSIPRITWGKFEERDGKYEMTLDIAANHALLDGEPMSRAFIAIQAALNDKSCYKM